MKQFELNNPTRMIFGPCEFDRLGEIASGYGKRPLVVIGKSYIKDSGWLDKATELLMKAGLEPVVFEGIEPNPRLGTVTNAAKMAVSENCDMVIGIGGGSVMDASKAIAFGFYDPDNIWKGVAHWEDGFKAPDKALPIILASTLAATGSEGNSGGVLTNEITHHKAAFGAPCLFPKVSIIDPELMVTVPKSYTLDGAIDMCMHVLESYFNGDPKATFPDRMTEGFVSEVMLAVDNLLDNLEDLNARYQLAYLGAIALYGFINKPRGGDYPIHAIEHPLSAYFDVSHGRGLALLFPRWLTYVSRENPAKIIQFGERIFGLQLESHHPFEAADITIRRISEWLEDIGEYFFMDDLGIPNDPELFKRMAEDAVKIGGLRKTIGGIKPLKVEDVVEIYKMCVRVGAKTETTVIAEPITEEEVEYTEEVIIIQDGDELPEGVEGEDYVIVEEVVEEEE